MRYTQRALLAVWRRRKISVLLLIIFFVLLTVLLLGFSILGGVHAATTEIRKTFGSSFYITIEQSTFEANSVPRDSPEEGKTAMVYTGERIDMDTISKIASTKGIFRYNATQELVCLRSDQLKLFPGLWDGLNKEQDYFESLSIPKQKQAISYQYLAKYNVNLYSDLAAEFRTNAFELVEGRHITPEDTHAILMSDELAQKNGLKVGDTLHVYYDNDALEGVWSAWDGLEYDFTIVGLFHVNAAQVVTEHTAEDMIAQNQIFVDINSAKEWSAYAHEDFNLLDATFFVNDPAELDTVIERVKDRDDIAWEYFSLKIDETDYRSAIAPLRKMNTALWVTVGIVALVMLILLYLVIKMSLQSRGKEFHIYRSLGVRKGTVLKQLVVECLLLLLIAFIPASAISAFSVQSVGNLLLEVSRTDVHKIQAATDAEYLTAAQNGSTQDLMESEAALQTDTAPQSIEVTLPPLLALAVLAMTLIAVIVFLAMQFRSSRML